ncbi:transcriptional regulator [Sporanaerobium hydrogeniformans]|uniref:Transcriptional regulator n=1 Tax=Sporanaerobium hydrogeniformans TaxID=3072179 RepID=A0AC61D9Y4_9FIRM|nr:helix-turn-helix domain-containing protein [Sporanaerobium hydrogeniformans]PHV69680.1 transcriptional regulator [Sporanaerobium hydrogeniformans]
MYSVEELIFGCPVEALSNILGKKWVAVIIWTLQERQLRFGELQREVEGCTKKMLTQQLDLLVHHGIIINEKTSENNMVTSIYYLSGAGLALIPIMEKMIYWSNQNLICEK